MVKGLYRASSGMIIRQTIVESIANNLANIATTGFKRDSVFTKHLIDAYPMAGEITGEHSPHANALEMHASMLSGSIKETGNPFDVAISGTGFFEISGANGESFLTRSGHFTTDAEGNLVDLNGNKVQGEGGEISIPDGQVGFINENGDVVAGRLVIDKLKIVDIPEGFALQKISDTYFSSKDVPVEPKENIKVHPRSLEGSNVDMMMELTGMISAQKEYEAEQSMVHTVQTTLDRLIRDVGNGIN